ncbi:MAG: hypothetical protein EPN23_08080 [Verrucomicrobia bacterium]|nr:MAG: hypothetical protein EPN23_08080 [Verrucomicrobiota bacterium]
MTERERLQAAYELAFFPPRLHTIWNRLQRGPLSDRDEWARVLDMAIALHLALPERGFSSPSALHRLAHYQAQSRAYGMPRGLYRLRTALGVAGTPPHGSVPAAWVRDIGLPEFRRPLANQRKGTP